MTATVTTKTVTAPVPSTVQGKSTLGKLLFALNASVTAFSLFCFLLGYVCLANTNVKIWENKFTIHGLKYFPFFFSLWGSVAQSIYFYTNSGIDIIEIYSRNSTRLYKIRNNLKSFVSYLFFTAVFPMSVTIGMQFWGLYFIDRELIYPRILDEIYPTWVNHAMHSIPVALVFIYVLIESEPPMKHTLPGMMGILALYAACVSYVKQTDDKWVYIALHEFRFDQAIQLFCIGAMGCIFTTCLGHTISRAVQSIYNMPNCDNSTLNHWMLLVGYGLESGKEYWILKNSWGTEWGEQGYVRMSSHRVLCGLPQTFNI